ncbi:hypothetical protein CF328_g9315, partial [Tilletia controversa]
SAQGAASLNAAQREPHPSLPPQANTGKTTSTTESWADQVQAADEARKAQADLEAREAAAGRALKRKAVSMSPLKERSSALDAMESTSDSGADTDTSEARASVRTKAPLALKPASVQSSPESAETPAAKEVPAAKEAPASPAKRAAPAAKTRAKSAPRPLQALERRIQAALSQRDEKEAALRGFFETLTTGLRNIEGLNALHSDRVE